MKKPKPFATEADLCAAFVAWMKERHPQLKAYAEWAGWDLLVVYPEGFQLGIQAKLRLSAEVIGQAAPLDRWGLRWGHPGPDYRGVLVPDAGPLHAIALQLGLVVITASQRYPASRGWDFHPDLMWGAASHPYGGDSWLDWNPARRHELPPCETDAVAGSPCPVTLTHWKLGALAVLAELEVRGSITTKRMRALGINPGRWTTGGWLSPTETRGVWKLSEHCPRFHEQHPAAYALALKKAREAEAQPSQGGEGA